MGWMSLCTGERLKPYAQRASWLLDQPLSWIASYDRPLLSASSSEPPSIGVVERRRCRGEIPDAASPSM
jgi:hypothetical protein